jgi:hypothetical protein
LNEDIGAWLKEFGLNLFAHLKADLTVMVKSPFEYCYTAALDRVHGQLQQHPRFLSYLENHIHAKRHLFAHYIVKTYPGHLNCSGNAPAECNHASIVTRLGRVVISPVELVKDLMQRHSDISAERNLLLTMYHFMANAEALRAKDASERNAIKQLAPDGLLLFRRASAFAIRLEMSSLPDGRRQFTSGDNLNYPPIILDPDTTEFYCDWWIAYCGCQCGHLLLLKGGFDLTCWKI